MKRFHARFNLIAFIFWLFLLLFLVLRCTTPVEPEKDFVAQIIIIQKGDTVKAARLNGEDLYITYLGYNNVYARIRYTGYSEKQRLENLASFQLKTLPLSNPVFYITLSKYQFKTEIISISENLFVLKMGERIN